MKGYGLEIIVELWFLLFIVILRLYPFIPHSISFEITESKLLKLDSSVERRF